MSEKNLYTQMRNEFYNKFRQEIVPKVFEYEKERKQLLKEAIIKSIIFFAISIFFFSFPNFAFLIIGFYFFVMSILSCSFYKKDFEIRIKKRIMPIIVSCFENLSWKEGGYPKGYIYEFVQVVPQHDTWYSDDVFEGEHNGINFEISETSFLKEMVPQHTDRYGRIVEAKYTKVFEGIIVKFDMNKNFTGHTLIKPDKMFHNSPQEYMQRTVLESVEFEKKYDVFTTDEIEARYIITPAFMDRLKNIKFAFNVKDISCGFYNNNLFLAMPTKKDIFSIGSLYKPLNDEKQYFQMFEEILSIIKLIDHFKLNEKTGL